MADNEILEKLKEIGKSPFAPPFDPEEVVSEGLFHTDVETREHAIDLAGALKSPEFIKPLFHLVAEDPRLEVRKQAIEALGRILHQGKMADYHQNDRPASPDVQLESGGLSRNQFQAIQDFMARAAGETEWPASVRSEALVNLAAVKPEEANSLIDKFYHSGERVLTIGAVRAIARTTGGDWAEIIMKELSSRHSRSRRLAAVEAAGVHGIDEAGPELVNILKTSDDSELRQAAVETLGMIPWSAATKHLEKYTEDTDEEVSRLARQALLRQADQHEKNRF